MTMPRIMVVRINEKPNDWEIPTDSNTAPIETAMASCCLPIRRRMRSSNSPIPSPKMIEPPISMSGSLTVSHKDGGPEPASRDAERAAAMLYRIRARASSIPTTARRLVVNGPLASYSASTSTVAAGAVADANAPKMMDVCQDWVMT